MSHNLEEKKKSLSIPSLTESVGHRFLLKMASVSDFVPVRRELIKSAPPKPFLIGVAGGSASGKVKVNLTIHFAKLV